MPWAGGSYTKGNSGTGGWVGDASLGIGIEAGRHDTQDNDFATGINQCINKDGSNAFTADPNLGGFKPTNIAAGTAAAPALCVGGDVNTGVFSPGADTWAVATNGTERLRVNSTGQVAIGLTSPGVLIDAQRNANDTLTRFRISNTNAGSSAESRIDLGNDTNISAAAIGIGSSTHSTLANTLYVSNGLNAPIIFSTAGTTRMRVDGGGKVGVPNTTSNSKVTIDGSNSDGSENALFVRNSATTGLFSVITNGYIFTGLAALSPYNNTAAVSANLHVAGDGILYRATSSLKYKKDIEDMNYGLDKVLALRPVIYKGKAEIDGDKIYGGLIAEEVDAAGLSEFVQYANDGSPDALAYGNMVALAFKAIQELNTKVEALKARVDELEGA